MATEEAASALKLMISDLPTRVSWGEEGLIEAATLDGVDCVITAVVGMLGLKPTLAAIRAGKRIGLANKETLVCAGELVMAAAKRNGVEIVPVDSEHSALFQSLQGCRDQEKEIKRLILTASGGPFFGWKKEALEEVTLEQALKHPNWSMGAKITVDSATLMNKGLEFIEAMHLYQMPPEKISIVVHRESIIHSLVEYCDNAVIAQLGSPDMRLPIQYALTWPDRTEGPAEPLDLLKCGALTFAEPDYENFPCLGMAMEAARVGGTACVVLNGANEEAVAAYLRDEIGFYDISDSIRYALDTIPVIQNPTLEQILEADKQARQAARTYFEQKR
jgi:1-deoxy-D-xylulose-5-phosphate reductoisomerase